MSHAWRNVVGDRLLIAFGVLEPVAGAAGRVDADDAVGPDAELAQPLGDPAALADLRRGTCLRSASPPIAEPPPVGGQTGATTEPITRFLRPHLVGELLQVVVGRVDVDVRGEQEQVDAVELDAVDLGLGGQVEHRVEVDERLGAGRALPTTPGQAALWSLGKLLACELMR